VWLKLSDDFAKDLGPIGLSDAAFRTHVEGLLWAMDRLTDGVVRARDLVRLAETADPLAAVAELVAHGLWREVPGDGWQIVHGMADQIDPDTVRRKRENNAERQRRFRQQAAERAQKRSAVTRYVARDETRDPGRDGSGPDGVTSTTKPSLEGGEEASDEIRCDCGWPVMPSRLRAGLTTCMDCSELEASVSHPGGAGGHGHEQ
jgi:hypothetical protein